MKKNLKSACTALTGMIALGMLMAATRAGAEAIPQVAQIVKVEGNAQYSMDGRTWQTLHVGDVLKQGAVIRTAEKSLVDVMLGDEGSAGTSFQGPNLLNIPGGGGGAGAGGGGGGGGAASASEKANVVRIFQSTVLGIDKLDVQRTGVDEVTDTQLDLRAGQILANVKKLSAQSKYEIKVPNGVAGIRGAWGLVSSSDVVVSGDGNWKFAQFDPSGQVQVHDIPRKHKFDPAGGKVVEVSDADYAEYSQLDADACSSAGNEPGARIAFIDISCGHTCAVDGN